MRKPNKRLTKDKDKRRQHYMRVLLPSNWIDYETELQSIEEENDKDHANWTNSDTNSDASDKISLLPE